MVVTRVVVIGVGNEFRRDDGVGPAVVARMRELQAGPVLPAGIRMTVCDGDPGRLIDLWEGTRLAVVIDAARVSPGQPGRVHRVDLDGPARRLQPATASTHGLGLGEAIELARALGRMPGRLVVYAVEGADRSIGCGLTPVVASMVSPLANSIARTINPSGRGVTRADHAQDDPWAPHAPP